MHSFIALAQAIQLILCAFERTPVQGLQSKTEKKVVTSAAIAYAVFLLIKSRFRLLRRVGACVGEVISRLSRAGISLFPPTVWL